EVRLDSNTVSRQHAVLFKDPFDRWWIRDLGSRNGTRVNGEAVAEHVLAHGDQIEIETFKLIFASSTPTPAAQEAFNAEAAMTITDPDAGQIKRLRAFASPLLSATHLTGINEFGTRLLKIASREQ